MKVSIEPQPASRGRSPVNYDASADRLRAAFTLIELLVSVTLVVLMMLMFAEIFQLATGSMSTQRGIALNDQRSRSLSQVIRGDLWKRTFRFMVPFSGGESDAGFDRNLDQRQGYFYISENDPNDDSDDVLQFTVRSSITRQNSDETPFFGRAELLGGPGVLVWRPSTAYVAGDWIAPAAPNGYLYVCTTAGTSGAVEPVWPTTTGSTVADGGVTWSYSDPSSTPNRRNQPDVDDGTPGDHSASSIEAEVSYFLRNGNLYRRVLLIRELTGDSQPYDDVNEDLNNNGVLDPLEDTNGNGLLDTPHEFMQTYTGTFWNDFDFSAYRGFWAKFHGIDSLNNAGGGTGTYSLGIPLYRFGHFTDNPPGAVGMPVEYVGPQFIGRFTHEETSDATPPPGFQYPQGPSVDPATLTLGADGVVDQYRAGPRRAEDILMTNVHAFDVKVWDDGVRTGPGPDAILGTADDQYGQFVDVGHNLVGFYNQTQNGNVQYGPRGPADNRVFDTWHPNSTLGGEDINGNGVLDLGEDTNGNGLLDTPQPPFPIPVWRQNFPYGVGDLVRPATRTAPGPDAMFGTADDQALPGFAYRCQVAGTSGSAPPGPPWPTTLGGTVTDGTVTWQAVPNLQRPLRAIQITIRFRDLGSDQMRQLTIVHSLVD